MTTSNSYELYNDVPDDLLEIYLAADLLAVDTELQGLQMGRDKVCLVQLCDREDRICLVRTTPPKPPPNLKKLLSNKSVLKLFHYALTDVAFLRTSLGIKASPFRCTKVMSKLVRTYTEKHNLKSLVEELVGVELIKVSQTSDWSNPNLTKEQLVYAANDVLHLIPAYETMERMIENRGKLPSGITLKKLNERSQAFLPTLVELLLNGYGDKDRGWETSLFAH